MPTPKEALFPETYRATQVQALMDAVARRRSIAMYGLAGMGKSNILRFLASHPRIKARYLGANAEHFRFVFVDCNLGDARTEDGLLRELDLQLERAGLDLGSAELDGVSLRFSIRLRLEAAKPESVIVILLDPLDEPLAHFESHFWAFLRGLRDLRGNLVYVLGARRPPQPLRELQELLTEACWVTPLTRPDALDSLARDANRLGVAFSQRDRELLAQISGGHPGLLKNCAELAGSGRVSLNQSVPAIVGALLAYETIHQVCSDVWSDLQPEWQTLQGLALNLPPVSAGDKSLDFLEHAGVVRKTRGGHVLFSPLLRAFIISNLPRVIRVRVGVPGAVILESWQGRRVLALSNSAYHLLRAFAQRPGEIFTRAQLARVLALGDPHYSDEAVVAHVKRLRKLLNETVRPLVGDERFDAILSARKQGYRLQLEAGAWTIEYEHPGDSLKSPAA